MKKIALVTILAYICRIGASEVETVNFHQQSISLSTIDQVALSLHEIPRKTQYKIAALKIPISAASNRVLRDFFLRIALRNI